MEIVFTYTSATNQRPAIYLERSSDGYWVARDFATTGLVILHRRRWTPSRAERNRERRGLPQRRWPAGHPARPTRRQRLDASTAIEVTEF